ncbi:NADP-dependent oxidoreductase [uncultured Paraglaciecola sp.]|uniref:NADP-dependent oxidoreductase n=1 Tax=uncultured Paraglaciecola sp. TaxID=1765024 RepID=UPI002602F6FE|nr:NADP-dependent oxidoreductase [uncultured Paraglaciecola sp.]
MSNYVNRAIVLAQRPNGEPVNENFRIEEQAIPELKEGDILVRTLWLSLDPYMRPRMNDMKSYMEPAPIDGVLAAEVVGEVVESRSNKYAVGDRITAYGGWQEYFVKPDNAPMMYKIEEIGIPLQAYLGAAGMTGRTAYFGLHELGKPQKGETLVVSAASGAVGGIVGQIGKMLGCRVVGVAGGSEKCKFVVEELGFDACVDYKAGNLEQDLQQACPDGIDIYFENVGGAVTRAVATLMNPGSRVPICGYVSNYNDTDMSKIQTPQEILAASPNPPAAKFFVVTEWQDQHQATTQKLAQWIKDDKLVYRESIAEGLDQTISAFQGMLKGKNFGKQLVRITTE